MIRYLKHIVKIILIFALIMCWGISLGYANNIASENKALNFYFENENYNTELIENIKKEYQGGLKNHHNLLIILI